MSDSATNKRPLAKTMDVDAITWGKNSSKKPRFDTRNPSTLANNGGDEVVEDPVLELDEIGKGGNQLKRNAVRLEGYDSDSSVENFDSRANTKAESRNRVDKSLEEDDQDDDMFADADEDHLKKRDGDRDFLQSTTTNKNKSVRFLEDDEIEGQVRSSKSGGHVSSDFSLQAQNTTNGDDESDSSGDTTADDEERARIDAEMDEELGAGSKKRHAPKLDAFNMRDEAKEGRFDENGNFVRNAADPYAVHDSWLESSSRSEMKRANEAHMKREELRRKKSLADDSIPVQDLLASLITRLERGETALEALGRLNDSKPKKKHTWQRNRRKGLAGGPEDVEMGGGAREITDAKRREIVEAITTSADRLLTRGQADIYELEREALIRQYSQETGEDWKEELPTESFDEQDLKVLWEFRWTDNRDKGEIHGPFDEQTMKSWNDSGFFNESVEFRPDHTRQWTRQVSFL